MRYLQVLFSAVLLSSFITACHQKTEESTTGVIIDGTMNSLMIIAQNGDTLSFTTIEADCSSANGMLAGDTATVFYFSAPDDQSVLTATKVIVSPAQRNNNPIMGAWTQPANGSSNNSQGMQLNADGSASSINMATLQYESWTLNNNQLILTGKSIDNGQTIEFTDTMTVVSITPDSLILSSDGVIVAYSKAQ